MMTGAMTAVLDTVAQESKLSEEIVSLQAEIVGLRAEIVGLRDRLRVGAVEAEKGAEKGAKEGVNGCWRAIVQLKEAVLFKGPDGRFCVSPTRMDGLEQKLGDMELRYNGMHESHDARLSALPCLVTTGLSSLQRLETSTLPNLVLRYNESYSACDTRLSVLSHLVTQTGLSGSDAIGRPLNVETDI